MDLGLGNLATLKTHLLKGAMNTDQYPDLDIDIAAIGRGVSASFERYCNRVFKRAVAAEEIMNGGTRIVMSTLYPVEAVTRVELKGEEAIGFEQQDGVIRMLNNKAGLIVFFYPLGESDSMIRITLTGGYWWNTAEPPDDPDVMPDGANELPEDLKFAWLMQCENVWSAHDRPAAGFKPVESQTLLSGMALVPEVKRILDAYRRLSIL